MFATDTGMVKAIWYPFNKFGYLYCLSVKNFAASWIVPVSLSAMDSQTNSIPQKKASLSFKSVGDFEQKISISALVPLQIFFGCSIMPLSLVVLRMQI